jgi:hypothetical protein
MSLDRVNPEIDDVTAPARAEPESRAGGRWSIPQPPRPSLPVAGVLIYAGIRAFSVAIAAYLLGHGQYRLRGWSLVRWMRSSDGGHYQAIAAHGYTYPAGQLAHASVFSWFPGYPAVIDSIAWLPGVTIVMAGLVVTAVAGLAAAETCWSRSRWNSSRQPGARSRPSPFRARRCAATAPAGGREKAAGLRPAGPVVVREWSALDRASSRCRKPAGPVAAGALRSSTLARPVRLAGEW